MTSMLHIFKKDLRRLRWAIAAWLLLVGVRLIVDTVGTDMALGSLAEQIGIRQVARLLSFLQLILLAILVSLVVHDEPLVGRNAFWLTRPMPPVALMSAKALFAATFFVVVPLLANMIVALTFDIEARDVTRLIPVFLLNQVLLVSLMMLLAVLTPSFTKYAIAIVAIVSAFVVSLGSYIVLAMLFATEFNSGREATPDPTRTIIGAVALIATVFTVIAYQYQRRRLKQALLIAVAGSVFAYVVFDWWPWSYVRFQAIDATATPQNIGTVQVAFDATQRRVTDGFTINRRTPRKKQIAVKTIVTGVPVELRAQAIVARSTLELPGGVVVQSGDERPSGVVFWSSPESTHDSSIEAALGGSRLLTKRDGPTGPEQWPPVLQVEEDIYANHRAQSGRLTANVEILFDRPVVRAAIPLRDGSRVDLNGTHFVIVRVVRRATGCTVFLRQSAVEPLFSPRSYSNFLFVLRNRARAEAAFGANRGPFGESFIFDVSTPHVGGRGFVFEQVEVDFPQHNWISAIDLDDAWVSGAEFVIIEIVPAGHLSRTATIDDFRMAP